MPANIDPQILDSVALDNVKTIGESGAFFTALSMKSAVQFQDLAIRGAIENQNALSSLTTAAVGAQLNRMALGDVAESMSQVKLLQSNLADNLAQLQTQLANAFAGIQGAIESIQQGAKTAQTTPPKTA